MGLKEHHVFPEVNMEKSPKARGMNITFVTTAGDNKGQALLEYMGMPFKKPVKQDVKTLSRTFYQLIRRRRNGYICMDGECANPRSSLRASATAARSAAGRAATTVISGSRICLRKMAHEGLIPGLGKSSW